MSDGICFAGLDVHAHKTAAAAVRLGSGEVFKAQLGGSSAAAIEWLRTLPGPVRAVYQPLAWPERLHEAHADPVCHVAGSVVSVADRLPSLWQPIPRPSRNLSDPSPRPNRASQYFWPLTSDASGTVMSFQASGAGAESIPLVSRAPGWSPASL